ncbi:unnamed protein product [Closterium sp. Naga37s-1]|nr:unnamed protein product [Closterium sp. Naga37s-1]
MTVHHASALLVATMVVLLLCPAALPAAADAPVMFRSSRRLTTSQSLGLMSHLQSWFRGGATAGEQQERSLVEQVEGGAGAGSAGAGVGQGPIDTSGAGEAPAYAGGSGATDQGAPGGAGPAAANQGSTDTGAGGVAHGPGSTDAAGGVGGAGAAEGPANAGAGGAGGTPGGQAPADTGSLGANQGPPDQPDAAAAGHGGNRAEPTLGVRMRDLVVWRAAKFHLKAHEAQTHMAAGKTKAAEAHFLASALENATDVEASADLASSCVEQMGLVGESVEEAAGLMESGGEDVNLPRIHLSNAVTLALDCAEGFDLFAPGSSRDPRVKALQEAAMEARALVMEALGRAADMAAMIAAGDDTAAAAAVPSPSPTRRRLVQATTTSIGGAGSTATGTAGAITVADPHNSIPETSTTGTTSTGNPGIMPGGGSPTSANNTAGAAVTAYPKGFKGRYVVFIQPGFYREKVLVNSTCKNVTLLGTGAASTVISWYDNATAGTGTFQTPTVAVDATGFVAIGIRFENTAGKAGNQAVAFRLTGDGGALYECEFIGWQDTLYTHGGRQYYRNCYVNGSVDFIFGNGAAVLDNCTIHIRPHTNAPVTASGRTNYTENTGIVLLNSLNTSGWLDWNGVVYNTSTFIEQGNSGPGSVGPRIAWALPGIVTDPAQVAMYYPNTFLAPFSSIANLIPFSWL